MRSNQLSYPAARLCARFSVTYDENAGAKVLLFFELTKLFCKKIRKNRKNRPEVRKIARKDDIF